MSLYHPQWLCGWQPAHYHWCLQSHLVSCFYAGSLCHQLQSVWPCRVNFLSMKCGFGLHLWLLWKSDRGFLPLTLKKMVKRPTVFWALVFVGFLCTFLPGYFILSFSQTLLCLSQRLCMYVPSHPLEQVGARTAGPKTARSWCVTGSCFPRGSRASRCVTEVLQLSYQRWFPTVNGSSAKWP